MCFSIFSCDSLSICPTRKYKEKIWKEILKNNVSFNMDNSILFFYFILQVILCNKFRTDISQVFSSGCCIIHSVYFTVPLKNSYFFRDFTWGDLKTQTQIDTSAVILEVSSASLYCRKSEREDNWKSSEETPKPSNNNSGEPKRKWREASSLEWTVEDVLQCWMSLYWLTADR